MGRTKERSAKIERIRIIACILVVWNHIQLVTTVDNSTFFSGRALLYGIIQTNVPLFILISGFLMFQKFDMDHLDSISGAYVHKIKNFVVYVFIPSFIIVVISAIFYSTIVDGMTIQENFAEKNFQWSFIKDYIFLQDADYICNHLWYIWAYAKVVLAFPLLVLICQEDKDKTMIRRFLMTLSMLNIIFVDLRTLIGKEKGDFSDFTFDHIFIYILIGYELYLLFCKKNASEKQMKIIGSIAYVVGLGGKIAFEKLYFVKYGVEYVPMAMTVLSSVGAFMVLYSLKEPKMPGFVSWLGKNTLYIYMVHVIIIFYFRNVWNEWFWNLCGADKSFGSLILYTVVYGTVVFLLALALGLVFKIVYEKVIVNTVEKGIEKVKRNTKNYKSADTQ